MSGLRCSDGSLAVGEPLAGSAPPAVAWVALEQNGPWGARAFTDSHLDPEVGAAVEQLAARHEVRPSLIRRPGRHADTDGSHAQSHRVLVAHTRPGRTWLLHGAVTSPTALLELDWAALQAGDLPAVRRSLPSLRRSDDPVLLVCTNARRDVCCAVKGRPVALGAAATNPGQVWEATHTSGHRFAPTAVLLPAGTLHGRLDVARAGALLHAAARGSTVLEGSRGRSTWAPPAQAAELTVRRATGILDLDALEVVRHEASGERCWTSEIRHVDGRAWQVVVEARESGEQRPESCGKPLKQFAWYAEVSDSPGGPTSWWGSGP